MGYAEIKNTDMVKGERTTLQEALVNGDEGGKALEPSCTQISPSESTSF